MVVQLLLLLQPTATTYCNNLLQQPTTTTYCNNLLQQPTTTTYYNNLLQLLQLLQVLQYYNHSGAAGEAEGIWRRPPWGRRIWYVSEILTELGCP